MITTRVTVACTLLALAGGFGPASAQMAGGSTTANVSVAESMQVTMGWSVNKSLLGKGIYNESGERIGQVEDLIVSPDRTVSHLIVGAGGFIGIGQHNVAVPMVQIQERAGKFVMNGATKESIKALPRFAYADDGQQRERFVLATEQDIAKARTRLAELEKQATGATADGKVKLDQQIGALRTDADAAGARLAELRLAAVERWQEFEDGVSAATARLRKTLDDVAG